MAGLSNQRFLSSQENIARNSNINAFPSVLMHKDVFAQTNNQLAVKLSRTKCTIPIWQQNAAQASEPLTGYNLFWHPGYNKLETPRGMYAQSQAMHA